MVLVFTWEEIGRSFDTWQTQLKIQQLFDHDLFSSRSCCCWTGHGTIKITDLDRRKRNSSKQLHTPDERTPKRAQKCHMSHTSTCHSTEWKKNQATTNNLLFRSSQIITHNFLPNHSPLPIASFSAPCVFLFFFFFFRLASGSVHLGVSLLFLIHQSEQNQSTKNVLGAKTRMDLIVEGVRNH